MKDVPNLKKCRTFFCGPQRGFSRRFSAIKKVEVRRVI